MAKVFDPRKYSMTGRRPSHPEMQELLPRKNSSRQALVETDLAAIELRVLALYKDSTSD